MVLGDHPAENTRVVGARISRKPVGPMPPSQGGFRPVYQTFSVVNVSKLPAPSLRGQNGNTE